MLLRFQTRLKRTWLAATLSPWVLLASPIGTADELQPQHPRRHVTGDAFIRGTLQVAGGNEQSARAYYRGVVAGQMKFMTADTIEGSSIKDLLAYFGYPAVNARDLHQLSSDQLMALGSDGDILATAFFAPKISKVETPPSANPTFGWRKLVRFKAKPGSAADANGMELLFFLQNVFERSPTDNPFEAGRNVSLFNQAIATRKVGTGDYTPSKRALYFFAYGPLVKCGDAAAPKSCEGGDAPIMVEGQFQDDGAIGFGLKATFDARNPETEAPGRGFYYVPGSCQDCHGKSIPRGKVNYLDTDHWFDRVKPSFGLADGRFSQEDFTALSQLETLSPPRHGILYDGGPDVTTAQFKKAFEVIRKLNTEIKAQNSDAASNPDVDADENFPLRAVTKWLQLHDPALPEATRHVPPHQRGFRAAAMGSSERTGSHPSLLPRSLLLPVSQLDQIQRLRAPSGQGQERRHRVSRDRAPGPDCLDAAGSSVPRPDTDGRRRDPDRRSQAVPRSAAAAAMTGSRMSHDPACTTDPPEP